MDLVLSLKLELKTIAQIASAEGIKNSSISLPTLLSLCQHESDLRVQLGCSTHFVTSVMKIFVPLPLTDCDSEKSDLHIEIF